MYTLFCMVPLAGTLMVVHLYLTFVLANCPAAYVWDKFELLIVWHSWAVFAEIVFTQLQATVAAYVTEKVSVYPGPLCVKIYEAAEVKGFCRAQLSASSILYLLEKKPSLICWGDFWHGGLLGFRNTELMPVGNSSQTLQHSKSWFLLAYWHGFRQTKDAILGLLC